MELQNKKAFSGKDLRLPYVGLEHIAQGAPTLLGTADSSSSVSVNSLFEKDDILFGKLRPNLRKSLRAPFRGYCSTDILVLRCREGIVPGFAGHVFQWQRVFAAASATAAGTRMPRASWDDLKRLYVFAPKSELAQEAIATVLNAVEDAIAKTGAVIVKPRKVQLAAPACSTTSLLAGSTKRANSGTRSPFRSGSRNRLSGVSRRCGGFRRSAKFSIGLIPVRVSDYARTALRLPASAGPPKGQCDLARRLSR